MKGPRVALIGAGVMGANHARVVADAPQATLGVVIDVDLSRASALATQYGFAFSTDVADAARCDAAILSSSTDAHYEIALYLLEQGVPLLIEKPIASTLGEVERICDEARRRDVPITCGFVERFNPVLDTMRRILEEEPVHIVTMRHSPQTSRAANSVIYDLLIHDIDLVLRAMSGRTATMVGAASWHPDAAGAAEIADCILRFDNGALATLSASRAGQRKLRSVQIFTPSVLAEIDLLRADLTIYRNVRQEYRSAGTETARDAKAPTYRAETIMDIPFVRHTKEPLALQFDHFLDLIGGKVDQEHEIEGIIPPHRVAHLVEVDCLRASRDQVAASGQS